MKRFKTSLALFLTGIPLLSSKVGAVLADVELQKDADPLEPVRLHPLNLPGDNQFAAHRSHSSHASHRSHRSSSGGGGTYRAPAPAPSKANPLYGSGTNQSTDPGRPAQVSPAPAKRATPTLSRSEKLQLQVMRVQIALTTLGLYDGNVDGIMGDKTREAIKRLQALKGYKTSGQMTTETLNALGVPAVP